ncbi:MAG: hypothetical protein WCF90_07085 [Methanomicrobiales archaeon]
MQFFIAVGERVKNRENVQRFDHADVRTISSQSLNSLLNLRIHSFSPEVRRAVRFEFY